MKPDAKFTVTITLVNDKTIVLKNLTVKKLEDLENNIWISGQRVMLSPGKWELVSPYVMKMVTYELQKENAGS